MMKGSLRSNFKVITTNFESVSSGQIENIIRSGCDQVIDLSICNLRVAGLIPPTLCLSLSEEDINLEICIKHY